MSPRVVSSLAFVVLAACNAAPAPEPTKSDVRVTPEPKVEAPKVEAASVLKLGAPITTGAEPTTLAAVAKTPDAFAGKSFTTTGTVSAVCQHRGCWMELTDEGFDAHVKMAGHAFFVPRTAAGKKARVMGRLVQAPEAAMCDGQHEGAGKGCKAEAEQQLGRPLAKLELVADGVEIL